jgi:cell wall-associated NlpC family hydrolase
VAGRAALVGASLLIVLVIVVGLVATHRSAPAGGASAAVPFSVLAQRALADPLPPDGGAAPAPGGPGGAGAAGSGGADGARAAGSPSGVAGSEWADGGSEVDDPAAPAAVAAAAGAVTSVWETGTDAPDSVPTAPRTPHGPSAPSPSVGSTVVPGGTESGRASAGRAESGVPSSTDTGAAGPTDPDRGGPSGDSGAAHGSWATHCTHEVSTFGELREAMLTSGPDEIVCLRGPTARPTTRSALAFARSQLGQRYVWGGNSRADGGFDCSGLTSASYSAAGVPIPRTAQAQYNAGHHLSPDQPVQAGDLVFFGRGPGSIRHVGIAISPTQMIDAPDRGQVVKVERFRRHDFVGASRPSPAPAEDPTGPETAGPETGGPETVGPETGGPGGGGGQSGYDPGTSALAASGTERSGYGGG